MKETSLIKWSLIQPILSANQTNYYRIISDAIKIIAYGDEALAAFIYPYLQQNFEMLGQLFVEAARMSNIPVMKYLLMTIDKQTCLALRDSFDQALDIQMSFYRELVHAKANHIDDRYQIVLERGALSMEA